MVTLDEFNIVTNGVQLDDGYFNNTFGELLHRITLENLGISQSELFSNTGSLSGIDTTNSDHLWISSGEIYISDDGDEFDDSSIDTTDKWTVTGTASENTTALTVGGGWSGAGSVSGEVRSKTSWFDPQSGSSDSYLEFTTGNATYSPSASYLGSATATLKVGNTTIWTGTTGSVNVLTNITGANGTWKFFFDLSAETVTVYRDSTAIVTDEDISGESDWTVYFKMEGSSASGTGSATWTVNYFRFIDTDSGNLSIFTSVAAVGSGKTLGSAFIDYTERECVFSSLSVSTNNGSNYATPTVFKEIFSLSTAGTQEITRILFTKPANYGTPSSSYDPFPSVNYFYTWCI